MSPRSWAQICWLRWQKEASLLVADPEPLGTGTCLLQTLNQDLCNFFPLFQTRVCLPGLLARKSEILSARSISWYRTCYPPTQRPPLHTVWSLMKPFRWRLLMSTRCAVLPCTEVFKAPAGSTLLIPVCGERSLGFWKRSGHIGTAYTQDN